MRYYRFIYMERDIIFLLHLLRDHLLEFNLLIFLDNLLKHSVLLKKFCTSSFERSSPGVQSIGIVG